MATVEEVAYDTLTNDGGTWWPDLTPFQALTGYIISIEGHEQPIDVKFFDKDAVAAYIDHNADALAEPGRLLGTWVEDNIVYLDVSVYFTGTLSAAKEFAKNQHQRSFWDIANDRVVYVDSEREPVLTMAELPKDQAKQLRIDIVSQASKLGVEVIWAIPGYQDEEPDYHAGMNYIRVPMINTDVDYLIAMHELGHHVLAPEQNWMFFDEWTEVEEEAQVWRWAIENSAIPVTQEMYEQAKAGLATYEQEAVDALGPQQNRPEEDQFPMGHHQWFQQYQPVAKIVSGDPIDIPKDSREELTRFWHEYPDLRQGCKDKYGFDPIDDETDYWRHGLGDEPEHASVLKAIHEQGQFTPELVKEWEKQELADARKEKTSMAERSGDPQLDSLIEEFMQDKDYEVNMYRDSETAWGACADVSEFFADWLAERGIRANTDWDETVMKQMDMPWAQEGRDAHPFDYGYQDRPFSPEPEGLEYKQREDADDPNEQHHTTIVQMPSGTYSVDFTASQYGYTEFPMVQKLQDGGWQRQWIKTAAEQDFTPFFTDATQGAYAPQYQPQYQFNNPEHQQAFETFQQHSGNFDTHIDTSIPDYRGMMIRTAVAVAKTFGPQSKVIDIGGAEGSWAKTVAELGGGQTATLDPNKAMQEFSLNKSHVPGHTHIPQAFGLGFTDDDGTEYQPYLSGQGQYDAVFEAMTFQFISNDRDTHIAEAKNLLKPNGLLIVAEKVITNDYPAGELGKDLYKAQFYSPEQLKTKQEVVNVQGDSATGMMANMVHQDQLESILSKYFTDVKPFWSSYNFKGYIASDDAATVQAFLNNYDASDQPSVTPVMQRISRAVVDLTGNGWKNNNWELRDDYWETRRPWAVHKLNGDIWVGEPGTHHDSHPEAVNVPWEAADSFLDNYHLGEFGGKDLVYPYRREDAGAIEAAQRVADYINGQHYAMSDIDPLPEVIVSDFDADKTIHPRMRNWADYRHPVIYTPNEHKVYVGPPGSHHEDIARHHSLEWPRGMGSIWLPDPEGSNGTVPWFTWHTDPHNTRLTPNGVRKALEPMFDELKDKPYFPGDEADDWTVSSVNDWETTESIDDDYDLGDLDWGTDRDFESSRPFYFKDHRLVLGEPGQLHDDLEGGRDADPMNSEMGRIYPNGRIEMILSDMDDPSRELLHALAPYTKTSGELINLDEYRRRKQTLPWDSNDPRDTAQVPSREQLAPVIDDSIELEQPYMCPKCQEETVYYKPEDWNWAGVPYHCIQCGQEYKGKNRFGKTSNDDWEPAIYDESPMGRLNQWASTFFKFIYNPETDQIHIWGGNLEDVKVIHDLEAQRVGIKGIKGSVEDGQAIVYDTGLYIKQIQAALEREGVPVSTIDSVYDIEHSARSAAFNEEFDWEPEMVEGPNADILANRTPYLVNWGMPLGYPDEKLMYREDAPGRLRWPDEPRAVYIGLPGETHSDMFRRLRIDYPHENNETGELIKTPSGQTLVHAFNWHDRDNPDSLAARSKTIIEQRVNIPSEMPLEAHRSHGEATRRTKVGQTSSTHRIGRRMAAFFPRLSADIAELASKARQQLLGREDVQKLKRVAWGIERYAPGLDWSGWPENSPVGTQGEAGPSVYDMLRITLVDLPDEGFKLFPWIVREFKKGVQFAAGQATVATGIGISSSNLFHAKDILQNAVKWMVWSKEHNQPVPDYMSKQFGFQELEQWTYKMDAATVRDEQGWESSTPVYTWPDGWHMDVVGSQDLALEGKLMGHCVGGYCDEVNRGDSTIVSLRDPKGMPHVTIEFKGDQDDFIDNVFNTGYGESEAVHRQLEIIQIQGKNDSRPIPEYQKRVDEWLDHLRSAGWEPEETGEREPEQGRDYNDTNAYAPNHEGITDFYHAMINDPWQFNSEDPEPEWEGNIYWERQPDYIHHHDPTNTFMPYGDNDVRGPDVMPQSAEVESILIALRDSLNKLANNSARSQDNWEYDNPEYPRYLAQAYFTAMCHIDIWNGANKENLIELLKATDDWINEYQVQVKPPKQDQLFDTGGFSRKIPKSISDFRYYLAFYVSEAQKPMGKDEQGISEYRGAGDYNNTHSLPVMPGEGVYPVANFGAGTQPYQSQNYFDYLENRGNIGIPGTFSKVDKDVSDEWGMKEVIEASAWVGI